VPGHPRKPFDFYGYLLDNTHLSKLAKSPSPVNKFSKPFAMRFVMVYHYNITVLEIDMKKSTNNEGWWKFIKLCRQCKTERELDRLLHFFLTLTEKEAIDRRVKLVKELLSGENPQRIIAQDLNISIAKITRGSNQLKIIDNKLKRFLISNLC
jgi:TrpR family trp operon transcriptional repressor